MASLMNKYAIDKEVMELTLKPPTLQRPSGCFNHRVVTLVAVSWRTVTAVMKVYFGSSYRLIA